MNKIKQAFENFWKVKHINKELGELDKKKYYELFLDGYACALIDIDDAQSKEETNK